MIKPLLVIQAPISTRSGYGDMARGIALNFLGTNRYDVRIVPTPWGNTPMNALDESRPDDKKILDAFLRGQLARQPDIFVQITVPSEFQPVGKFNIGITAGIETTICDGSWIQGCNKMNLVLGTSEHAAHVLRNSTFSVQDQAGNAQGQLKLEVPCEVWPNGLDTRIFRKISTTESPETVKTIFKDISESFNFLFVGHWLQGEVGQDRKDVGMLIKVFCETFKNMKDSLRPALILKTSNAGFSLLEREDITFKVKSIRESVAGDPPNVYLIWGDLTQEEMNGVYNHYKVKVHCSLTKGEGFGRPLLEASLSQKPIMVSGWSGHLDFLDAKRAQLIGGELKQIHQSAVVPNLLLAESQWFTADYQQASTTMSSMFQNYSQYITGAKELGKENSEKFSLQATQKLLEDLLDKYVPKMALPMIPRMPSLPKLKKV